MNKLFEKIKRKLGDQDIFSRLTNQLSFSEFNSLLLEFFRARTKEIDAAKLLRDFERNRFVKPAQVDAISMKELELSCLKKANQHGFEPVILSPVAPLGTCSAMALVDQNNVLTALRGTEVVADVTNVMALFLAEKFRQQQDSTVIRLSCVHRHIRCQHFKNPNYSAHFSVCCMVSSGLDTGNYDFEIDEINKHIRILLDHLAEFDKKYLSIKFYLKKNALLFREKLINAREAIWRDLPYEFVDDFASDYYHLVQFKIFYHSQNLTLDIADGGLVDWTRRILSNKKHRMCISALGLELFYKIRNGVIN